MVKFNSQLGSLPNSRLLSDVLAQLLSTLENVMTRPVLERIAEKTLITDDCHLWQAAKTPQGYGLVSHKNKMVYVHRFMYETFVGTLAKGECVLHKCDTPACNNPDHLFTGSHKTNSKDMIMKGRSLKGENSPQAVLTSEQVLSLRAKYTGARGDKTNLAKEFNISRTQVGSILNRETWKHV